jgi:hypothetical protein
MIEKHERVRGFLTKYSDPDNSVKAESVRLRSEQDSLWAG